MTPQSRRAAIAAAPSAQTAVVTKAVLRAADRLGLPNRALAAVLGLSEATVSRMGAGSYELIHDSKPFELAILFVRLFRSLDAIVGGDAEVARQWLQNENTELGATPVSLIRSVSGLVNVVAYLDARRALI